MSTPASSPGDAPRPPARLVPVPGEGRLFRADDYVLFTAANEPDLLRVLVAAPDRFKALAEYIVKRSFDVTDLALISPVDPLAESPGAAPRSAVLFGDITLVSSTGRTISAATTSTWLEVGLADEDVLVGTPAAIDGLGSALPALDLDLQRGYVTAGGFVLAPTSSPETVDWLTSLLGPTTRIQLEEVPAVEVETQATEVVPPEPSTDGLDAEDSLLDPLADPSGFDLDRLGSEPSVVFSVPDEDADRAQEAPIESPVADPEEVEAGPDAAAFPADATPPLADHPPRPPVRPPPGTADPETSVPNQTLPPPPRSSSETLPPGTPPPPPPTAPPPTAPPPTAPPSHDPSAVTLRFDDGQAVEVTTGLYVGRHPTKSGLPTGFEAVTIRGEQVSRRHWQLVVTDGRAVVSDLGSAAGTGIEKPGQNEAPLTGSVVIEAGDIIRFADRWAIVEAGTATAPDRP